jgi:hypothetical protein
MKLYLLFTLLLLIYSTVSSGELEDLLYHEATKDLLELKYEKLPKVQIVNPEKLLILSHQMGSDWGSEEKKFYPRCKDRGDCRENKLLVVLAEYRDDVRANKVRKSGRMVADEIVNNYKLFPYFKERGIIGGERLTNISIKGINDEKLREFSPGELSGIVSGWLSGASSSIIFNEMNGVEKARNGVQITDYSYGTGGMFLPTKKECDDISDEIKPWLDIYQKSSNKREIRERAREEYVTLVEDGSFWEENCIHRIEENGGFTGSTLVGGDSINYNASGSRDLITGTHSEKKKLLQLGYNGMSIKSPTQPLQDDVVYMGHNNLDIYNIANVYDVEDLYTIQKTEGSSGAVYGNGGGMGYFGTESGPQTVHHIFDPHVDRRYKGKKYIDAELEIVGGPVDFNDIEVFRGESNYTTLMANSFMCKSDYDGNGQVTMSELIFIEMSSNLHSKPTLLSADFMVDYKNGANKPYRWKQNIYPSSNSSKVGKSNLFKKKGKYSTNYLTTRAAGHYNVMYSFAQESDCDIDRTIGEYAELEEIALSDLR